MLIKYKLKFFLAGLLLSYASIASAGDLVPFPNKEKIQFHKDKIIRDVRFGKVLLYGAQGSIAALLGYAAYKWFKSDQKISQDKVLDNEQLTNKLLKIEKKYEQRLEATALSGQWLKNMGNNLLNGWLFSALSFGVWEKTKQLYKRYGCFGDLEVLIGNNKYIMASIENVLYNAQIFDLAVQKQQEDIRKAKNRIIISCKNLIDGIELVIAFMEYKLQYFSSDNSIDISAEEKLIPVYLLNITNDFCEKLQKLLDNYRNPEKEGAFLISAEFREDFAFFIEEFQCMESRIEWES